MEKVETFAFKQLLSPMRAPEGRFFAADYTLNLYRGCNHGCIYCDTRSECYQIDRFDTLRVKENCIPMLEKELRAKKKPGIVFLGAASDGYNAIEKKLEITRQSLLLFKKYSFGVGLTTKSDLAARDAALLSAMGKVAPAYCTFSITTAEDELSRLIEPGAPVSSRRFAAMEALAGAGVFTGLWLNPVLPFLTDSQENIAALLARTAQAGGRYAVCHFGMTLRTGNREYFYSALDKHPRFRGIKQRYVDAFKLDYECPSPKAEALYAAFKEECQRLGLLYRFVDINRAMAEHCPAQLSLF